MSADQKGDINELAKKFVADVEAEITPKPKAVLTPVEVAILREKWQGRADNFNLSEEDRAFARAELAKLDALAGGAS